MLLSAERALNKCFGHYDIIIINLHQKYLSALSVMPFILFIWGFWLHATTAIALGLDCLPLDSIFMLGDILPRSRNQEPWGSWFVCHKQTPKSPEYLQSLQDPLSPHTVKESGGHSLLTFSLLFSLTWWLIVYCPLIYFIMLKYTLYY